MRARRLAIGFASRYVPTGVLPARAEAQIVEAQLGRAITAFADRRIPTVPLLGVTRSGTLRKAREFDAFVVGSDQIWRPEYADVASFLLDFLPDGDARPRLSYAGSFGVDWPRYSEAENRMYRELAQRLSSVSVREVSGIEITKEMWGVDAQQHVDPTMLRDRAEYAALADGAADALHPGRAVSYILDHTEASVATRRSVESAIGENSMQLLPNRPKSFREFRQSSRKSQWPSVEAWLGAILNAQFVITDSFHGAVFAILGNVPFVVICNRSRGAARFQSLLSTFGLMDRLVEAGDEVSSERIDARIDWEGVNARLALERERSKSYLRTALRLDLSRDSAMDPSAQLAAGGSEVEGSGQPFTRRAPE